MALIYASATEHFNKRTYRINRPAYYDQTIQRIPEIMDGTIRPLYNPGIPDARVYSRAACCDLMDMAITKVPFEILEDRDVLEILHVIDNYLLEVRLPIESGRREYVIVAHNVLALRSRIYPLCRRVFHRHPSWKAKYKAGTDTIKSFLEMATLFMDGTGARGIDPVDILKDPPFRIPDIPKVGEAPKPIEREQTPFEQAAEFEPAGFSFLV